MYVLGIDGGGTKTTGVITRYNGEILTEVTVGGTNLNSKDRADVILELVKLINGLKEGNGDIFPHLTSVFAGMSGAGNKSNQKDLENIIGSILPHTVSLTVDDDAITALYSGTMGEPGIVQIAGTGAITYGVNQEGKRDRVGGWGHYFSDQGSGYSIGRDGLKAAFMAYDGMEQQTLISDLLLTHFQTNDLPNLISEIYQHANPKEKIASLSKVVGEAADQGDAVAIDIINDNAVYLGRAISILTKKLFPIKGHTETIPIVLAGGLFNRYDLFKKPIENTLLHNRINAKLIIPSVLPVGGAVMAALKEKDVTISEEFLLKFKQKTNKGN